MNRLRILLGPPSGPLRTVEEIRARASKQKKVITALTNGWTLSRITSKHGVSTDYVKAIAKKHHLSVERPSDNWVRRP